MKEAAGEANMTVITIVLIAIVLAVGTVLVRNLLGNTKNASDCTSKGNVFYNGSCFAPSKCTSTASGATKCS